ncbi:MAG TPA: hypothetical protein VLG11_04925 [Candidatus Saccharimonadales bacterium]|nr:hypothetical protein [Candidatus Saccharimonadales bacterium]
MSEFLGGEDREPYIELAKAAAASMRRRTFYARKLAHVIIAEEMGLRLGEEMDAIFAKLMGVCVGSGIGLGMLQATDSESIDAAAQDLVRQFAEIQPELGANFEPHVPDFIMRGIELCEEISQGSARIDAWTAEFQLLERTGLAE